jgi:hypothetical protein
MGKNVEGSGRDLFEVICRNLNGGTEENHKNLVRMIDIPAGIRTENLPNISQEHYHYANTLDIYI